MADRKNIPWDAMAERVAELLKHQLNKPGNQAKQPNHLGDALEKMITQQQQTNEQLQKLHRSAEAQIQEFRDWQASTRRSASKDFLRKMALEIPPVVIAVLLAFGINSWWQQQKSDELQETSIENIHREIQTNLADLEQTIMKNQEYLQELKDQVSTLLQDGYDDEQQFGSGISIAPLKDAAWQAANISGAVANFSPESIQELAEVYSFVTTQIDYNFYAISRLDLKGRLRPETLLLSLETNLLILENYIEVSRNTADKHRLFLEKYVEEPPTEPTN